MSLGMRSLVFGVTAAASARPLYRLPAHGELQQHEEHAQSDLRCYGFGQAIVKAIVQTASARRAAAV